MAIMFVFISGGKQISSEDIFNDTKPFIPSKNDEVFLLGECYEIERVIHKYSSNHTVFFTVNKSKNNSNDENLIYKEVR